MLCRDLAKVNPYSTTGDKAKFGDLLAEFPSQGWVHSVQFTPSGSALAFASHDATVSIAPVGGAVQTICMPTLPFRAISLISDAASVTVGHEVNPHVFTPKGGQL